MEGNSRTYSLEIIPDDAYFTDLSVRELCLLELSISLVILWYLMGWEALVGAAFYFVLVVFQLFMARKAARLRAKAAAFTDKRLVVVKEIISGIRAVKLNAWEWKFRDAIRDLRREKSDSLIYEIQTIK